jgi:UDP-2,3-diacylglucosamine pyrophosphatase LpxH
MKSVSPLLTYIFVSALLIFFSESCIAQNYRFGVIADVQYADKETAGRRHYRTSLQKLDEAVSELNRHSPDFVLQLGDVIDGHSGDQDGSVADLKAVMNKLNRLSMPVYHVVGNHCLSAGQDVLKEKLQLHRFYYTFTRPGLENWRFIVLDGNDAGYGVVSDEQFLPGLQVMIMQGALPMITAFTILPLTEWLNHLLTMPMQWLSFIRRWCVSKASETNRAMI